MWKKFWCKKEENKVKARRSVEYSYFRGFRFAAGIGWRGGQVNSRKHDAPRRRFYGGGQRRGAGVSTINTSRRNVPRAPTSAVRSLRVRPNS